MKMKMYVDCGKYGNTANLESREVINAVHKAPEDDNLREIVIKKEPMQNAEETKDEIAAAVADEMVRQQARFERKIEKKVKSRWWMWVPQSGMSIAAIVISIVKLMK